MSPYDILQTKTRRFEERQPALRYATDVGRSTVEEYGDLAAKGALSLEDAQRQALGRLKAMRYGKDDGYYTLIDSHPTVVLHPIKAEGSARTSRLQGREGQCCYRNVAAIAKGAGEGSIECVWPKPGHRFRSRCSPRAPTCSPT